MSAFQERWENALAQRSRLRLTRHRRCVSGAQGVRVEVDGKQYLSFASNDYLGLAAHPELQAVMQQSLAAMGVGSGASHMVCGHHRSHQLLEEELAAFTGRDRALVFSSGYSANLAVLGTLAQRHDAIIQDKLNHASLIDGALLSGASHSRYRHADTASLALQLERLAKRQQSSHSNQCLPLVVTDGVFSMDGDVAPLEQIVPVCEKTGALLVVDDAHGIGVLGARGAGTLAALSLAQSQVPVLIGTFGKAFGTAGAFVAGSASMIEYLEQFARPYIYTTAMPPALAEATRVSLRLLSQGDELRARLHSNISLFKRLCEKARLQLMPSDTAIQPLIVGDSAKLLGLGSFLEDLGFLVGQIRPPTVPEGTARLRITLSAAHSVEDVEGLVAAIELTRERGLV